MRLLIDLFVVAIVTVVSMWLLYVILFAAEVNADLGFLVEYFQTDYLFYFLASIFLFVISIPVFLVVKYMFSLNNISVYLGAVFVFLIFNFVIVYGSTIVEVGKFSSNFIFNIAIVELVGIVVYGKVLNILINKHNNRGKELG